MTNIDEMTNTELEAALEESVNWSNWYFNDQDWRSSEHWHNRAVELQAEAFRRVGKVTVARRWDRLKLRREDA